MQSCSASTNEAIVALSRLLNQKLHHKHCKHNNKPDPYGFFGFLQWIPGASPTLSRKWRAKAASQSHSHSTWSAPNCGQKEYEAEFDSIFHSTDKKQQKFLQAEFFQGKEPQ